MSRITTGPTKTAGRQEAQRFTFAAMLVWGLLVYGIVPETIFGAAVPGGLAMPTEGSPLGRAILLILLGGGVALALSRSAAALKVLRQVNPFLLVFYCLVLMSAVWSIDPATTIRRMVRLLTVAAIGVSLAVTPWRPTRFQSVIRPVLTFLILGSIVFAIVSPKLAIEQGAQAELIGAWHGLSAQKNAFGCLAAITFILWWHAWLARESPRWLAVIGAVLSVVCLWKSRSSTSLAATVFASLLLLMMLRSPPGIRRYLPYLIGIFVAVLLIYSLAVLDLIPGSGLLLSPITTITGKDQTFSGRTAIWAIMNNHITQRPLLGSGYGAYWIERPDSPSMEMLQRLYFYPTEAHNGYLDVIDDLGFVGGLCLMAYLVAYLRQALRIFTALRSQGALYLTLLFLLMVLNLSESRWLNVLDFTFSIMTIGTIMMARTLIELGASAKRPRPNRAIPRRAGSAGNGNAKPYG